jgi:hypothetical protein
MNTVTKYVSSPRFLHISRVLNKLLDLDKDKLIGFHIVRYAQFYDHGSAGHSCRYAKWARRFYFLENQHRRLKDHLQALRAQLENMIEHKPGVKIYVGYIDEVQQLLKELDNEAEDCKRRNPGWNSGGK